MVVTISNVYIQTYEQNVRHLAQQMAAKLRDHVTERSSGGQNHNWERIGSVDAVQKTAPRTPTPEADTPWSRRVSLASTWHVGDTSELEDPVQMLVDPNSNLATSQAYAMKRSVDDLIIAAATGDATIEGGGTATFPSEQIVGNYSAEISFDMVTEVQELFMANDIDPDYPKCAVVGPKQVRRLMQLTEQTSSDYVQAQALQRYGIVPNWLGFTWINSTRLNVPAADQKDCLFFTPAAIGLQVNKDITAKVSEDPSISFAWRIYSMMVMGAVRVEDEHIVWAQVADTVT